MTDRVIQELEDGSPYQLNVVLRGVSPLTLGKRLESLKSDGETNDNYELRCWRERAAVDDNGFVIISGTAIHRMAQGVCKKMNLKIPGAGTSKYWMMLATGILVPENPRVLNPDNNIGYKRDELPLPAPIFTLAQPGSNKQTRVDKYFPTINKWKLNFRIVVLDTKIFPYIGVGSDVIEKVLRSGGYVGGLGTYRPSSPVQPGGTNGRFVVESISGPTLFVG